ncbi:caspase, EACC1-associated type [Nostoc mirabile]|uniref:caspase, EACC1-associated type n=1 Tax=Nostoc mirabile TaxID=2907820 RepID=UPI0027DEED5F|nr:SUMF1/EgtB/PvdO family nonheme iron enzyme [Nostoc mirabile]
MAKVALLVGVSEYEPGLNPLPSAVRDVEAVYEVLLHTEMGGFAASDVTLLKNPERQVVEIAIETLFSGRDKDDLLLLYFSGHGIKDDRGRLYLATRNTSKTQQGELIRSTSVSANFIHDRMSESRSRRQVVILDSCFSGAFAEGMSAKDDGMIDIREQLGGEGRAVLTSSTSTQYSFEQEGQDLSIYTRFLIEGIKSGEADRDQDEFISIDELHEYASQKVRELQPAMKPEIYAIREGFKIRLAKVAPGDPRQRYRKEVARFIHRGEISLVGRRTLDYQRTCLGLETTEAKAIEDEILEPYRNQFREKLQHYQQVFTELLERDETITDSDRHDLQNLQQTLGLRNEDTMPIEAQVTAQFKTHQQNLQTYQQAFTTALRQEFLLSAASRDRLRQTQQQLELADRDIAAIESQITAEVEAHHQKLRDYERLFFTATQQEYPLSEATRNNLRQQQQRLGLRDVDVAPIEAQITTQIESYHQKLQQYEQAFVKATQRQHYPDEVTQKQLQQTWQTLGLSEGDVRAIERRINAEIATHQANLRQYEQEFTEGVQQEYPLSAFKRSQLTQRHQALNLTAEDVTAIENPIIAAIKEHQQKLQQYEEVFRESMQFEYPLSDVTREELQRFQRILELNDAEIAAIEALIIQQSSEAEYQKQQERIRQQQEAEKQQQQEEVKYHQKLQHYEQELIKTIKAGNSFDSDDVRQRLRQFQRTLGLKQTDITAIETRVVASQELIKPPIQQPSSAQPTQSAQERITLQRFLKWAGLGGVDLMTAVVGGETIKRQSPTTISVAEPKYIPPIKEASKAFGLPLWTVKFETVTVDKKGQVIKRDPNKQAKFFKEDLGNGITLDMVQILGGSFNMGSPPGENGRTKYEEPQHAVNVPAFFIGKFEVTQEQYQQIMGSNPSNFKGAKRPVETVSWNDAVDFCKKLSEKTGHKYRLPSEAEWEYACRAGTTTPFHFGETITIELANYDGNYTYASAPKRKSPQVTTEVGSFPPNAFGLYDMHGNVWEWCQDTWHDSYKGAPSDGSAWIDNNQYRILRGGSWVNSPRNCRSASRNDDFGRAERDDIYNYVGFRVVCAVGRTL